LKRDLEYCEHELRRLIAKLPQGCQRVMHGKRQIGILMPPYDILPKMRVPLRNALEPFENHWFIGLSGEVLAQNGSMDPLASHIKEYSASSLGRRERSEPQNVFDRKPWKPGR